VEKKNEFVIDSSIVTKWFLIEDDSKTATEVRDRFATRRMRLVVPTLLFYEVMNAVRFSGAFDKADLATIAASLSKYQFEIWRPMGKLLELSAQLSLREDVTVYDACYVALAQRKGSRVITEDKELLAKFPALTLPLSRLELETKN
jgi:predicted nucleic acid-binding protein